MNVICMQPHDVACDTWGADALHIVIKLHSRLKLYADVCTN